MGIRDRPTAPRSPGNPVTSNGSPAGSEENAWTKSWSWARPIFAKFLRAYADNYNRTRTLLALTKDSPLGRPVQTIGSIMAIPFLGGLHPRDARIA